MREEGNCIQMLHIGRFDHEPQSFKLMVKFAYAEQLKRKSMTRQEIYFSDVRKTRPERLGTILSFLVE